MPRPRRRGRERRTTYGENLRVVTMLLCGGDFGFLDPDLRPSPALWAEAWDDIGEDVVAAHVFGPDTAMGAWYAEAGLSHEASPGTRPWGWWTFEADEPLRGLDLDAGEDWRAACWSALRWERWATDRRHRRPEVESTADYLTRLRLWLPGERELVARQRGAHEQNGHAG